MKTIHLLGFLLFLALIGQGQQVARDKVVVEIGTGTWCYYCPGAALGADDLVSNGKEVAIVEYHGGGVDPYINEYSSARISYYGVTGYPTAYFDGGIAVVGGNHTTSMYSTYLQKYNQRINVPSSFSIDMTGSKVGSNDYQVVVNVEKVDAAVYDNLVMHFVLTESDIAYSWQGMTEVNFVERLMVPDQTGTDLDFSSTNSNQIFFLLSLDPAWVTENCELIAFVQNPATKEVYQGALRNLTEFDITYNLDASIVNTSVPHTICQDVISPKIKLGNFGQDNLTSVDIKMQVNNETITTFNWTGNLFFTQSTIVQLPDVTFTTLEENNFLIWLENPNGQTDQFTANDTRLLNLGDAPAVVSPVSLALKLDDNPGETTWTLLNSEGTPLYSGGPYTQPNQFVVQSFVLNETDCYTFIISDAGGDGLTGLGMYKLAHQGSIIFAEGKTFGFEDQIEFGIGLTGIEMNSISKSIEIYPNPMSDQTTVSFSLDQAQTVEFRLFNSLGSVVYQSGSMEYSAGKHNFVVGSTGLNSGIYFLETKIGSGSYKQKLVIN
jgi:hypothetical protein